jgi:predicted nucleic acid-binding protein
VILLDTSGLLAALFPDQNRHEECARALRESTPPRITTSYVLAELDYLVLKYAGVDAELALLDEFARRAYLVDDLNQEEDFPVLRQIMEKYRDLKIGIADASLVYWAEVHECLDILTLDERHFRALRTRDGKPFRLLPADLDAPPVRTMPAPGTSRIRRAARR